MRRRLTRGWLAAVLLITLACAPLAARKAWRELRPAAAQLPLPPAIGTTAYGTLRDPAFGPLPGATARFGVYDGGVYRSVVKYLMGGDLPMRERGLAARYTANLTPRADPATAGSSAARAVSTRAVRYRIDPGLGLDEDALNATVRRLDPAPGSRSAAENPVFAEVTGRITVPLLSLHTTPTTRRGGDAHDRAPRR